MTDLRTPLRGLVGDKTAKALAKSLDVHTLGDLLRHYPRRYQERGQLTDLGALRVGDEVTVLAEVQKSTVIPFKGQRRGTRLEAVVGDGKHSLTVTFFNQHWRAKDLQPGVRALFAGKVDVFKRALQLVHPEYQLIEGEDVGAEFAGAIIPVYPSTQAVRTWDLARAMRVVLDQLDELPDPLPPDVRLRHSLPGLTAALQGIHRPGFWDDVERSRRRLKWDEAFVLQTALAQRRARARKEPAPARVRAKGGLVDAFEATLPFELTAGQQEVAAQLDADLGQTHPMHRLLQGEVGSGKTVVALRAMLTVVDAVGQAALLVPTEVLAQQHARSLSALLGPIGRAGQLDGAEVATTVDLLTGSTTAAARRDVLARLADGTTGIVVGTHALLEPDVVFNDLALVVVDEQHRFGVEQRDLLRAKGTGPHLLVMTATPIPRTVAMTVYGDLETSTLTELPRGRMPIATHVVPASERPDYLERTWQRVREEVAKGGQVFVVCPRISGDGNGDDAGSADDGLDEVTDETAKRAPLAVLDVFPMLSVGPLAGLRVELLHGRLPSDTKDSVMRRFAAGDIDVLVSTTVIEVGVDVPAATAMVVLDADRFGVSQLHQLRGRVGRGSAPAVCLLVTDVPAGEPARERLDAVAATDDGFVLARLDLEQRREGDVLGVSQAGRRRHLRLLQLIADEDLILTAREEAGPIVDADPDLRRHEALVDAITEMLDEDRATFLEKA